MDLVETLLEFFLPLRQCSQSDPKSEDEADLCLVFVGGPSAAKQVTVLGRAHVTRSLLSRLILLCVYTYKHLYPETFDSRPPTKPRQCFPLVKTIVRTSCNESYCVPSFSATSAVLYEGFRKKKGHFKCLQECEMDL